MKMDVHINNTPTNFSKNTYGSNGPLIVWSVVFLVVGLLIFLLNFATIATFIINKHLRRRSVYCLMNLAMADMLYGLFRITQQSLNIGKYLGQTYKRETWTTVHLLGHLVFFSSLFCLVLVSLERVYATFYPFRVRTKSVGVYIVLFIITWFLPSLPTFTSYLLPLTRNYYLIVSVSFLLCLSIIFTSYTAILIKVKKRSKQLQMYERQTALQIAQRQEHHLAITLFIVTVLSLLTWFPLIIFLALQMWFPSLSSSANSVNISRSIWLIQTINSLINPLIYVFRMGDFRKALGQLVFKCARHRNRIYPVIVSHGNQGAENPQGFPLSRIA